MIVTDPAGNNSTPVTVEAPDTTAPAPATDVQVAPDGSSVTGNAEPGATVGVDTDGDGQPDTTVVVGPLVDERPARIVLTGLVPARQQQVPLGTIQ